ncbi:putative cytokinetic ring protein SteA [Corynebacterium kroppenstedtii]|uniref:putative cytokinetic ring protein SteA n=1 Tax=Corynebacterium sp. PCR 32 TaxID=3351342 RepID=UPI00309873AB
MAPMKLFSRSQSDLPGLTATVRDIAHSSKELRKISEGDIVVLDGPDIPRGLAQHAIDKHVSAVVTEVSTAQGGIPRFGPQMLVDAGIIFVDGIGAEGRRALRTGKTYRLADGVFYKGEDEVARGQEVTIEQAITVFEESREQLGDHMEALSGNVTEFVRSESPLFIDGLGIPEVNVPIEDRKVIVVSPSNKLETQLKELRSFIREYDPLFIGVESAADLLLEKGYKPAIIVGDPELINDRALRSGATVVLPADPDGHAAGLERIQDLGIGAMTFPAATDSAADLALLIASYHGASLVVNCGETFDVEMLFDENKRDAAPSALLTRARVGTRLVDASAVNELYVVRSSGLGWLWAVIAIVIAIITVILIAGLSGNDSFINNLIDTWNSLAVSVQDLFK